VIVAAAEILGCITATSLVDPDVYYFSTSIAGEMDMRTTQVCYCTPAAILTDAALHQLFRYRYGIVHNIEPAYVEAKVPGLQAAFMKTFRQMAFGGMASLPLPIGLLDNGAVFSPTQAMIDLEVNQAIYQLARGIEVDDDTTCVDLINQLGLCTRGTYLETEHTLKHFREVGWNPNLFDRTYCDHTGTASAGDEGILEKADRTWRQLVAAQEPIQVPPDFACQLDRIVEAAKKELLI
jgi:trimethylamine:corrinoid methyltransferase-like protein